jgi:formylglycine-generating enzyme required for sulfatase activity
MGSPSSDDSVADQKLEARDDEKPQHSVTIKAFFWASMKSRKRSRMR